MLKKIYIDNYKSCVNFEIEFNSLNLLMGENGTGKSAVFEVLRQIQMFLSGSSLVTECFPTATLTRWQSSDVQSIELAVEGNGGLYRYELAIEHERYRNLARVKHERLWFDDKPLFRFEIEADISTVQMYRDDHSEGSKYSFDWARSALSSIPESNDNEKLSWFRRRLNNIIVVQIIPLLMQAESKSQMELLAPDASNFASWYRHVSRDQILIGDLRQDLSEIFDNFRGFQLKQAGDAEILNSHFVKDNQSATYRFDEFSEGQRVLVCLYTIIYFAKKIYHNKDYTVCIDEPDNFVALPEIQPWLLSLEDLCDDDQLQALLISHHPELIDYLVPSRATIWFSREDDFSPTRIKPILEHDELGISASELVARGWIDG